MSRRTAPGLDCSAVPAIIREYGRARGFERLRDLVLERPEALGRNLLATLKLVIELDRHALFSQVSEARAQERLDREAWEKFQEYLRGGEVTSAAGTASRNGRGTRSSRRASGRASEANRGAERAESPGDETAARREDVDARGLVDFLRGTPAAGTRPEGPAAADAGGAPGAE